MNILLFMADQLRPDHLGFDSALPVRTPHIDSLAATGHVFDRAYVANPVCMPNRATIMTGRWPSAHGLRTNGLPLDPATRTFPRLLRSLGWQSSAVGKLHLQPMGWPFEEWQLDEIKSRLPLLYQRAVSGPFGEDFLSWEDYERHAQAEVRLPDDYYGFDDVALTVGHGDRMSGNYVAWARARGHDPLTMAGSDRALQAYGQWPSQTYESAVPAALHPTTYVAEEAIARIERFSAGDAPWLLLVSFPDPHHPFAPPTEYWGRHDPADMPLPESFQDGHERSPAHIKRIVARRGIPDPDPTMTWAPTADQFRHALAAELGAVEFIDDCVGRVLGALAATDQVQDTAIVFTSDHGDLFGDHGLLLKHFSHYQGVLRVPMVITAPGLGTGRHRELASSADLAPTLLDLVDAPVLADAQGRSLRPIMQGADVAWRDAVLIEEDQPFGIEGLPGPVRIRTVVSETARLTEVLDQPMTECFDLATDPHELVNLAGADAVIEDEARRRLVRELMRVDDDSRLPFDAA
jgi:arylsulfatase A-like enzyme